MRICRSRFDSIFVMAHLDEVKKKRVVGAAGKRLKAAAVAERGNRRRTGRMAAMIAFKLLQAFHAFDLGDISIPNA